METSALKHVGQVVGLDLYERNWTGTALVIAPRSDLVDVRGAVAERWHSLLAAMSSGMAHLDPNDPKAAAIDKSYSEYQRVTISTPGAPLPTSGRRVVFFAFEETRMSLDDVSVAYTLVSLTDEWKKRLSDVGIVNVDLAAKS